MRMGSFLACLEVDKEKVVIMGNPTFISKKKGRKQWAKKSMKLGGLTFMGQIW